MTLAKRPGRDPRIRTINIGGDDITIKHVGFEISDSNWESFDSMIKQVFKDRFATDKVKSRAMRILVNAVVLGIIDLKDLEKRIEKEAEKSKEVIYI